MHHQLHTTCCQMSRFCHHFRLISTQIGIVQNKCRQQPFNRFASTKINPIKIQNVIKPGSVSLSAENIPAPGGASVNIQQPFDIQRTTSATSHTPNSQDVKENLVRNMDAEIFNEKKKFSPQQITDKIEEILTKSTSDLLTLKTACELIHNLGELNDQLGRSNNSSSTVVIDMKKIESDERFKCLCTFIQKGNFTQSSYSLVFALQGLNKLGFLSMHSVIHEMENELRWNMRRCQVRVLAKIIQILEKDEKLSSSNQQDLVNGFAVDSLLTTAVRTLDRRWVEAKTGSDFIALFGIASLPDHTNEKLEVHAAELVSQFSPMEMVKIVINLAKHKRRPTPLLRAIAFHMSKSSQQLPSKDIIELLYAFSAISFTDLTLMHKLCLDLASEIHTIKSPSLMSSLVTTIGRFRYKHKELTEAIQEWVQKNVNVMRPFDYVCWLLTSSVLNLNSEYQEQFYEKAKSVLKEDAARNRLEWLNIVHAFLVVGHANQELLSSVLKPQFIEYIDKLQEEFVGPRMKVLNINASLKTNLDSKKTDNKIKNQLLGEQYIQKWTSFESSQDSSLSKVVINSLSEFLPLTKYLLQEVKTSSGVFVDAVCSLNKKLESIPIIQPQNQQIKQEVTKIAILVAGYTSICLGSNDFTGVLCLYERLLKADGYKVVFIPFNEFNQRAPLIQRIQYLESKIKGSSTKNTTCEVISANSSRTLTR